MWWLKPRHLYSARKMTKKFAQKSLDNTVNCLSPDFLLGKKNMKSYQFRPPQMSFLSLTARCILIQCFLCLFLNSCSNTWEMRPTVPQNVEQRLTIWPRNSTPRYILKRNENICPCKLCINAYSSIIHNHLEVETMKMSINWGTDKQNEVYP